MHRLCMHAYCMQSGCVHTWTGREENVWVCIYLKCPKIYTKLKVGLILTLLVLQVCIYACVMHHQLAN